MTFNKELSISRLLDSIGDIKKEFLAEANDAFNFNINHKYKKIITFGSAFVSIAAVFVLILQRQRGAKVA